MKKQLITSLLAIFTTLTCYAQDKVTGHLNLGYVTPFTDLTAIDYAQYRPNLVVDGGISYEAWDVFRVRGNLMAGIINADNGTSYFESTIIEPSANVDLDVFKWFNWDSKVRLYASAGLGMLFYSSKRFNLATGALENQSPPQGDDGGYSPNGVGMGGGNIEIPITPKIGLTAGYNLRMPLGNDVIDASAQGAGNDFYGVGALGLTFDLKHVVPEGKTEVDAEKYQNLQSKVGELEDKNEKLMSDQEKVARLEMSNQEKDLKIAQLESRLDSLKNRTADMKVVKKSSSTDDSEEGSDYTSLGKPAYRLVVASLPSKEAAKNWIERGSLKSEEMKIAYIEKLDTYRVVYKSFETIAAAKKELQDVKMAIEDAWIAKF